MKRTLLVGLVLSMAATLVSCYDRMEIEDVAWIQAAGFDRAPEGILTTLQIGIPSQLRLPGSSAMGSATHYTTISIASTTVLEAIDLASLNLGRTISFLHTQVVVFGEELARSDVRSLVQLWIDSRVQRHTICSRG